MRVQWSRSNGAPTTQQHSSRRRACSGQGYHGYRVKGIWTDGLYEGYFLLTLASVLFLFFLPSDSTLMHIGVPCPLVENLQARQCNLTLPNPTEPY